MIIIHNLVYAHADVSVQDENLDQLELAVHMIDEFIQMQTLVRDVDDMDYVQCHQLDKTLVIVVKHEEQLDTACIEQELVVFRLDDIDIAAFHELDETVANHISDFRHSQRNLSSAVPSLSYSWRNVLFDSRLSNAPTSVTAGFASRITTASMIMISNLYSLL